MQAESLGILKAEVDRFLIGQGMKGYREKAEDWCGEEKWISYDAMVEQT